MRSYEDLLHKSQLSFHFLFMNQCTLEGEREGGREGDGNGNAFSLPLPYLYNSHDLLYIWIRTKKGESEERERETRAGGEREKYPGPPVLVLPWQLFIINK